MCRKQCFKEKRGRCIRNICAGRHGFLGEKEFLSKPINAAGDLPMTNPTCSSYLPCGGAKAPTSISPPPPMTADFTSPNGSKPVEETPPQNHVEDEEEDEDADEDAAPENGGANGMRSMRASS
jgi:hypothetical protein